MENPNEILREDDAYKETIAMAREYPLLASHLIKKLMLNTRDAATIVDIKTEKGYPKAVEEILKSDNIYEIVHLVLYYDPGLINLLFGDMNGLLDVLVKKPTMASETINKITDLKQAADINYDKDIEDRIVKEIEKIVDEYNVEMTDLTKEYVPELYEHMMNDPNFEDKQKALKQQIIDEVRNKGKRVLN